jgi:hypothetical protein
VLILPIIVVPFLCLVFFTLGGGHGAGAASGLGMLGLNTELPKARFDPKQAFLDKLAVYEKADHDSLRKKEWQRQDPYRRDSTARKGSVPVAAGGFGGVAGGTVGGGGSGAFRGVVGGARALPVLGPAVADPKADAVLAQLAALKSSLAQPQAGVSRAVAMAPRAEKVPLRDARTFQDGLSSADVLVSNDPKLGQLNTLLDKVIRIQHPEEGRKPVHESFVRSVDEVLPADSGVNTIAAVLPDDQTLTAGTTIALRITDSIRVDGVVLPGGQLVYGVVSINNDRLLVHVGSLRQDRNLFATDLQVYDLDGLPGIHIPGVLSRDVAKQSADQGVNSLALLNTDPTLAAQAASAGIQTVKTFVGRKVRQVRVSVRAGYQVLLRDEYAKHIAQAVSCGPSGSEEGPRPPGFDPGGQILSRCRVEGVELALRTICLSGGRLWFGLEWNNRSPIAFTPAYTRWFIRDRRRFRRTAEQELAVEPIGGSQPAVVDGDSTKVGWTGFIPFALPADKTFVVEAGEKNGGRVLTLVVDHREILKAKKL